MVSRKLFLASLVLAGGLGHLSCGEQDLYKPPDCPFEIVGRVALPCEALDVDVLGNYAYIAAGQGGLQVVDLTNPSDPELILWIDTKKKAQSIRVARTYDAGGSAHDIAFVAEGPEGITTYDISFVPDSLIDFEQGTTAADGKGLCIVLLGLIGDAYSVFLADSWKGVRVFFSDPDQPGRLGYKAIAETYGYTKALDVVDGYAYVAEDQMGVTVIDVRNVRTGGFEIVDNLDTPGNALGIDVVGDYVYVADGEAGLQIMKIGEGQLLEHIASLSLNGDCQVIEVHDGSAFLAAEDGGLHVVDVRDPYHPAYLGSVVTPDAVGVAVGKNNLVCIADTEDGLIVFRGPVLPADFEPPAAVTDLAVEVTDTTAVSVTLSWTAPGDDGMDGKAALYDIRWSDFPIADSTWEAAQPIIRRPLPKEAGRFQSFSVDSLPWQRTFYFALKTKDDCENWSEISNVAIAWLARSALSQPRVVPLVGTLTTTFTFEVTYGDAEGEPPASHDVIIDGQRFEMQAPDTAESYVEGVTFRYETNLEYGVHEYSFAFDNGYGLLLRTRVADAPDVQKEDPMDFAMVLIDVSDGVTFTMGSPSSEIGRDSVETQHPVSLTRSYEICSTEVHQYLYEAVMEANPSYRPGSSRPVDRVTWHDAILFCNRLSERDGYQPVYDISTTPATWNPDANGYRLPTEAEWEYACRAGSETSLCNGELTVEHCEFDALLDAVGWYCGNADFGMGPKTRSVASWGKEPNAFGLYDMHGNVWEWCWDRYADYPDSAVTDPRGPEDGGSGKRVRRGGDWFYFARHCRCASRQGYNPTSVDDTNGFRIARNTYTEPPPKK